MHVMVVAPGASERQELRLEPVVMMGLAGIAHGREKGILGGRARLPHGRGLEVRELEDGGGRRFLVLLHLLVQLQQPVVVVLLLLLLLLLIRSLLLPAAATSTSTSSSSCAVASVRTPVVVPRIQIPRLQLRPRYCCCSNARPSSSPDPITRRKKQQEKP